MSYTRTQLRHYLLDRWPRLGFYATADSFTTTAVVDVSEFQHSGYQSNEFKDYYLYRPSLTGNDTVKRVALLTQASGSLAIDSTVTVYVDTTTLPYELLGVHPDVINNAIATAQMKQYRYSHLLLTRNNGASDMDMQTSGVNYWDGTSGGSSASSATPTKSAVANNVYSGTQSLLITLSGANGYVRSETFRVDPSRAIYTAIIARADVGTVKLALRDRTNGAFITTGNDVAYSGEQFAVLERWDTAPSGCEEVNVEIRGTGASDLIYVDGVYGPWQQETRRVPLPSYLTEGYKVRLVRPAAFGGTMTPASGNGRVTDAYSRYWTGDFHEAEEWTIENFHREVAPNNLLFSYPHSVSTEGLMYLQTERRLSDEEPLTTESGTTNEDLEKEMAYIQHEVALALLELNPTNAYWKEQVESTRIKESVEEIGRPAPASVKPYGVYTVRV